MLTEMSEPELACVDARAESYRIFQSAPLNPFDFAIGVTSFNDQARLWSVVRDRADGRVVRSSDKSLTQQQWSAIAAQLAEINFWNEPTRPMPSPTTSYSMDGGGGYTVEGYANNRYHAIERDSDDKRMTQLAQVFTGIAQFNSKQGK